MGRKWPLLFFRPFSQHSEKYSTKFDYIKASMECLGFEPGTTGDGRRECFTAKRSRTSEEREKVDHSHSRL